MEIPNNRRHSFPPFLVEYPPPHNSIKDGGSPPPSFLIRTRSVNSRDQVDRVRGGGRGGRERGPTASTEIADGKRKRRARLASLEGRQMRAKRNIL